MSKPDDSPSEVPAAVAEEAYRRFGTTPAEIKQALLPLVRLMHKHGMTYFEIRRDGTTAHTSMR